jgi:hypothetical protein
MNHKSFCTLGGWLVGMTSPISGVGGAAHDEVQETAVRGCGNLACSKCGKAVQRVDGIAQLALLPRPAISEESAKSSRLYFCECVMSDGSRCEVREMGRWSPYHQGMGTEIGARWSCAGHTPAIPRDPNPSSD